MEIGQWELFWLIKLDVIRGLLTLVAIALSLVSITFIIITCCLHFDAFANPEDERSKKTSIHLRKFCFFLSPAAVLFSILAALMPNSEQMAAIHITPLILSGDIKQHEIPLKIRELLSIKDPAVDFHPVLKPEAEAKGE